MSPGSQTAATQPQTVRTRSITARFPDFPLRFRLETNPRNPRAQVYGMPCTGSCPCSPPSSGPTPCLPWSLRQMQAMVADSLATAHSAKMASACSPLGGPHGFPPRTQARDIPPRQLCAVQSPAGSGTVKSSLGDPVWWPTPWPSQRCREPYHTQ